MRYEKTDTVLRIAFDMQSSAEGVSLSDICTRYAEKPLSRRTAERLRDAVERNFPQMRQANPGELPKRWRLPPGTISGFVCISAAEFAALETALAVLKRENLEVQAAEASRAIAKMRALMKPGAMTHVAPDLEALTEAEGLALRPGPRPKLDPAIVETLRGAILRRQKVRLHYKYRGSGKKGFDVVRPYGFLYGNRHYLVAWSENKIARDFRNFALSNIERVEPLKQGFTRDSKFSLKAYAERSFGVFQEEPFDVNWKFSPKAALDAREFLFHPTQTMEDLPDGSLIVRFRAGGAQEMAWHLATWGDGVKVVGPTKTHMKRGK